MLVDDTFGIDSVDIAENAIKNGITKSISGGIKKGIGIIGKKLIK